MSVPSAARGRAAWDAAAGSVPWAERGSIVGIEPERAEGELCHVRLAEDDEPGSAHARDNDCVRRCGRRIGQRFRPRARRLALDVEEVLDRERNTREARQRLSPLAGGVDGVGLGARPLRVDGEKGARAFAAGIGDAPEARLNKSAARRVAAREAM